MRMDGDVTNPADNEGSFCMTSLDRENVRLWQQF